MTLTLPVHPYGTTGFGGGPFGGGAIEVDPTSEILFTSLPEFMQAADEAFPSRPLLGYVAGVGAELDAFSVLMTRLNRYTQQPHPDSPSDLADADLADPAWLAWLGQTVGVHLAGISDLAARRDAERQAAAGWRVGTKGAVAAAAASALTGRRYVRVYDHSATAIGDGSVWDLLLVTRTSETPDVDAVLAAVETKGAAPAGATLHHKVYSATFAQTRAGVSPDTFAARQAAFPAFQDAADYLPPGA